jgi:hypothetical protein
VLETLAGRLKWERTDNGIRVLLPRRFPWEALPGVVLAIFTPVFVDDIIRKSPISGTGLSLGEILWSGLCIAAAILAIHLSARTLLILTPNQLSWAVHILGRHVIKRTCRNDQLHGLRQNLLVSEWTGKDKVNQNVVEINRDGFYRTLASRLTDLEADALIAKIMEVYPFPQRSAAGGDPETIP